MSIFGSSAQATVNNQANISYSPFLNLGDDNVSSQKEWFAPTATASPKQDNSLGLAASVAVGSGDAGQATTTRREDPFTDNSSSSPYSPKDFFNDDFKTNVTKYLPYALGLTGIYILAKTYQKTQKRKSK